MYRKEMPVKADKYKKIIPYNGVAEKGYFRLPGQNRFPFSLKMFSLFRFIEYLIDCQ
jgi:hypothetical protein